MPEKQTVKERLQEITASIEAGIQDLFDSEKYKQYLTVMSRFHRYSLNNTMLIYLQCPTATKVCGFNKWKDQFGRNVKKGEKGIKIIAPTPYKKKIEREKLDPDTKLPMMDKEGNVIKEEAEIQIPMFRPVTVFDVDQTEGKPLPELAETLTGDVQNYDTFMEALRRSSPVPIHFELMGQNTDGYFSPVNQEIALRIGMSEIQTVSAAVHEIAHSKLHNEKIPTDIPQWQLVLVSDGGVKKPFLSGFDQKVDAEAEAENRNWQFKDEHDYLWQIEVASDAPVKGYVKKDRHTQEIEAESISFSVCAYYGIATGANSFGYLAGWSKDKSLPELRSSLETITKTANELITDIDFHYREICKEQAVDLLQPEDELRPDSPSTRKEYRAVPHERASNELSQSQVQEFTITAEDTISGEVLGYGRSGVCEAFAQQLNEQTITPQEVREHLTSELQKWHCYIIPDLLTWNNPALRSLEADAQKCFGRIDFIGMDGSVGESVEYQDVQKFQTDIQEETYSGTPFRVVLYRDSEGEVIPHDFIFELDPPPKGLEIMDHPQLSQLPKHRTPIEFYDSYEEALSRFLDLRSKDYNQTAILNPQSESAYARLTFGIQREDTPSAADLVHVRGNQNYLVDDFTRMEALHSSPEVMDVLHRLQKDIGFDRLIRHEKDVEGNWKKPTDMAFQQWENDYFPRMEAERPQLDEYPMPDPTIAASILVQANCVDPDLLPLSQERALELLEKDLTVYMIQEDGAPQMAFDRGDLEAHTGCFAVARDEWEQTSEFHNLVMDRMDHQAEREQAFRDYPDNCFAIYQVVKEDPENIRFMNMEWLQEHSLPVSHDNYDLVYTAPLLNHGATEELLNDLYERFNLHQPADFHSTSMSVSDIVVLKQNGVLSCHYVDSVGFQNVPDFMSENALKNAEMAMEDDYNMIDGVINNGAKEPTTKELDEQAKAGKPISLLAYAEAVQREQKSRTPVNGKGEKPSILAKIRGAKQPAAPCKNTKHTERER